MAIGGRRRVRQDIHALMDGVCETRQRSQVHETLSGAAAIRLPAWRLSAFITTFFLSCRTLFHRAVHYAKLHSRRLKCNLACTNRFAERERHYV
jgi:hypothetical protein